jgi:hypothetical protein
MAPTDKHHQPPKIALIPAGRLERNVGRLREWTPRGRGSGPHTHGRTHHNHARCARRPYATDQTSPTLPTPRGRHRPDPTATTPRRTGQPLRNAGHFPATDTLRVAQPACYQKTQPGHNGAAIQHFLMAPVARHASATDAGEQTIRPVYDGGMAAQRGAHKLPPGTRNFIKFA